MHLPKHDGEDILKTLRSMERCARTPVIVMTIVGFAFDRRRRERHAALHYFRKPSSLSEFMRLGGIVKTFWPAQAGLAYRPRRAEGAA